MTKANHRANVVRLGEPRVHTNADALELFDIEGYQVVTKKGQFKAGDLGVYIQPDSVVPQTDSFKFIWEHSIGIDGTVPERRRRITVRKFRGEYSEGLLMSMDDFPGLLALSGGEGDDVSEILHITHYDPDAGKENTTGSNEAGPRKYKRYPRSLKGWFFWLLYYVFRYNANGNHHGYETEQGPGIPVYDVEAYKNFKSVLQPGELVHVTEKIHGSNARYTFRDGHMYAGSRTQWKNENSTCIWRKALAQRPDIEEWCKAYEGYVLYGEVVPTQGNGFTYGTDKDEIDFYAFDVLTPEDTWVWPGNLGFAWTVPILYSGSYDEALLKMADGNSLVPGAKHIREGIVIRAINQRHVRGLNKVQLKVISNKFLEKDSK